MNQELNFVLTTRRFNGSVDEGKCFHHSELVNVHQGFWTAPGGRRRKVAIKKVRCVGGRNRFPSDLTLMEEHVKMMSREMPKWLGVEHPNVVPVLDIQVDEDPVFVSPYHRVTLGAYLMANPEANKLSLLKDVSSGLSFLHSQSPPLVHGGLSLGSVLMNDDGHAMVSNFGLEPLLTRIANDIYMTTNGTVTGYISAPEILNPEERSQNNGEQVPMSEYTPASDVFDFGSLILHVLSGKLPFYGCSKFHAYMAVMEGKRPKPSDHPQLSSQDAAWELIRWCWQQNSKARPSMGEVHQSIEDLSCRSTSTSTSNSMSSNESAKL